MILISLLAVAWVMTVLGGVFLTRQFFPMRKNLDLLVGLSLAVNLWGVWFSKIEFLEMLKISLLIWGLFFIYKKGQMRLAGAVFLILALVVSKAWFTQRDNFSLLSDSGLISNVNTLRGQNLSVGLSFVSSFFFNKSYYLIKIFENFLSHFNLSYLFARGSENPLLLVFLPFFIFGLISMIREKPKNFNILIIWFLLSSIPSLFLKTGVETNRFLIALFPLSVVTSWGILTLERRWIYIIFVLIIINLSVVIYNVI